MLWPGAAPCPGKSRLRSSLKARAIRSPRASRRRSPTARTADWKHAIEIDPRLAVAWYDLANGRYAKGDVEGAIADCTRAIELDPRRATAWLVRGLSRAALPDANRAIADLTRYLELAPDAGDADEVREKIAALKRSR